MDIKVSEPVAVPVVRPQSAPPPERLIQQRQEADAAKAAQAQGPAPKMSEDEVRKNVEDVNKVLETMNHSLRFSVDDATERVQVQVVEAATNKVLKEIPADSVLELSSKIKEMASMFQNMVGVLVDEFI
ncbi:MAG: flagellar protein FlaG [Solirubrobacterales bacterium]